MEPDAWVPAAEVAEWVGLNERQVRKLAEDQVIRRDGKGQYQLRPAVQAITLHLREQAAGRSGTTPNGLDLAQERAALARSQRIAQDAKNEMTLRTMVTYPDVELIVGPMLHTVRTAFIALPSNGAPRLARCKSVNEVFKLLTDMIHEVLEHLSTTEDLVEQVKRRMGTDV